MGKYEFLRHGFLLGAVMQKPDEMPVPMWFHYFRVPDIDAAIATISARGGTVTFGPGEIPGGEFVINALDPQGALFALVGARSGGSDV
jgi:predicted enzyme related to lactoylglutathione lyase